MIELKCDNCNKIYWRKYSDKRAKRHFCSKSCAAQFNNKLRKHSKETKEKIRQSIIDYQLKNPDVFKKFIESGQQSNLNRAKNHELALKYLQHNKQKICPVCGKEFIAKSYSTKYCSKECMHKSDEYRNNLRQKQLDRVKQGIHSGWQSRNIISYPEKFWIKVLKNNNISFEREKHVGKYFLDFVISINNKLIDLEIDGKQHKYQDRQISDQIRDQFLSESGYIVYRITWNEINSNEGKNIMKNKINKFINYLNKL